MEPKNVNSDDLIEFAKILGQQADFQNILQLVANKSAQYLKADMALIIMINPDTRETVKTIVKDGKYVGQKEYRDIHFHVGGWIINSIKPFLSYNIQSDNRFAKGLFDKVPIKSVAGVPLIIEGIIIGALLLLYTDSNELIDSDLIESLEKIAIVTVPFLRNTQKIGSFFNSPIPDTSLLIKYKNVGLHGKSLKFIELLKAIEAAAQFDVRILLNGKTGTGKELIANAIHKFSTRADFPFIAVDCGAVPNNLLESEFFGHKRGAFTGANSDRQGLFAEAEGGTLFMDEINNLPFDMQSKLLRVLEEGEVRPVGSSKTFKTNIRIIAASSNSLRKLVNDNKFREDLFFRLYVYPIYVPDLRERQEDISILGIHFLDKYVKQQNKNIKNFHEEVIDFMKQRRWKGNIRELENFVERIITIAPRDITTIDSLLIPADMQKELENFRLKNNTSSLSRPLREQMEMYEADIIRKALIQCGWNQSKAARKLKISESNIRYKIDHLNIQCNKSK